MATSEYFIYCAFRDGSETAFGELVRLHGPKLMAYLLSRLRVHDAEDIYQQTLFQIWESHSAFDVNRPFQPWLFRIAINLRISLYREECKRQKHEYSTEAVEHLCFAQSDILATNNQSEWVGLNWESLDWLGRRSKPSEQILIKLLWRGLDEKEIAQALNISRDTVKRRKAKLRSKLKPYAREMGAQV